MMLREHCRTQDKLKVDLGARILKALQDDEIYEIMLNPDGILWVDGFTGKRQYGTMSAAAAKNLINTIASVADETITSRNPGFSGELWIFLDDEFKLFRFQALIPPIVDYPAFAIRKRAGRVIPLSEFINDGIIEANHASMIEDAVSQRKSILVVGATQSGKTTLANAILNSIAVIHPDDRVIIIEDTNELRCNVRDTLTLRSSPAKSMNDLIFDCMRLRPDRIVIGEVRGRETHSLIKAWNTGHTGGVCTIHSNSAPSALLRLEQLIAEAGVVPVPKAIVEAVNIIVFIEKTNKSKKGRKVTSMLELKGHGKDGYITVDLTGQT